MGGATNLCLCDQTTQKLERHELIKMHSASPQLPHTFTPLRVLPLVFFHPSLSSDTDAGSSLMSERWRSVARGHGSHVLLMAESPVSTRQKDGGNELKLLLFK